MSRLARLATTGGAPTYVDDVFSTWLYDGNGSTQTITNGIDLAGQGGMVWIKGRYASPSHMLFDTNRGVHKRLRSESTGAEQTQTDWLTAFNNNGFNVGAASDINALSNPYASWTFRKAPKFFDVVTYTGDGTSDRYISHNLGVTPGFIVCKATATTSDWNVWARASSTSVYTGLALQATAAAASFSSGSGAIQHTSTTFRVDIIYNPTNQLYGANQNGVTYVAYLFAHDAATDGLIHCSSYTVGAANPAVINGLGWEPQFVLIKKVTAGVNTSTGNWVVYDNMRGANWTNGSWHLRPNTTAAEANRNPIEFTATGFNVSANLDFDTYDTNASFIYIAIRRPNKPPTTGTQVFQPTVYTGTNVDNQLVNTTIAPDMVWVRQRNSTTVAGMVVGDRLRGQPYLLTGSTAVEAPDADSFDAQLVSAVEYGTAFSSMNGFWVGNDATASLNANTTANNQIAEAFKRAPGFFDVVCYTGTGVARTVNHNLGAVPEMIIVKSRSGATAWNTYHVALGNQAFVRLNEANLYTGMGSVYWNSTDPTASVFSVGTDNDGNQNGTNYVAYLFASLAGISKVGSYTGNGGSNNTNGTSQTINCGFSTGARFVLVKRANGGMWFVFDSSRGIVAGNDPYVWLNDSSAEVTTVDAVDADNSGFIVNQTSGTNLNVTGASYIFLAVA